MTDTPGTETDDAADDSGRRPIGHVLDALGVTCTLEADELPASAIVLLRVIQADGSERLSIAFSDGQSWIERLGMLTAAHAIETTDVAQIADHHHTDDD